jgi:hypothetical protein
MRSLMICALAVSMTFSALSAPAQAADEWVPGKYMAQAVDQMLAAYTLIPDRGRVGFDDGAACVAGVYLRPGATYTLTRPFEAGRQYTIVAGGDDDATDVDIIVSDDQDRVIAVDARADRMAVVDFTPKQTGQMKIQLKLYKADRGSFCSFMVLRRGGANVPVLNVLAARTKFLLLAAVIHLQARELGREAFFLTEPNQAAVLGSVLADGQYTTLNHVGLGSQATAILAVGDDRASDLDLFLTNQHGADKGKCIQPDAHPLIVFEPSPNEKYSIRVANVSGNGRTSFVLFGILSIP